MKTNADSGVNVLVVMPKSQREMGRPASLRIREEISVEFPVDSLAADDVTDCENSTVENPDGLTNANLDRRCAARHGCC